MLCFGYSEDGCYHPLPSLYKIKTKWNSTRDELKVLFDCNVLSIKLKCSSRLLVRFPVLYQYFDSPEFFTLSVSFISSHFYKLRINTLFTSLLDLKNEIPNFDDYKVHLFK